MFTKLMIALLVIGGLAPFTFIKGKDGQPLMSFSDIKMPNAKVPDISLPDLGSEGKGSTVDGAVYKWKDKNGSWQFSSEPPPKGEEFTATVYDQNMNVIQSVETKRTAAKKLMMGEEKQEQPKSMSDLGSAYSPKKIEKLFDDANNLESLLNDRMKQQSEIMNNL